jgi:hypothetical protein
VLSEFAERLDVLRELSQVAKCLTPYRKAHR